MLDNNPMVKRFVASGEERLGKLAQALMGNEAFVQVLQKAVTRTLAAKGTVDKSVKTALKAMNLPSTGDLESLREKVDELDRLLSSVEGKLDRLLEAKKK